MLELFSRVPDGVKLDAGQHLTPLPAEEGLSDISAILLNDAYYEFLHRRVQIVEGVSLVDAAGLVPLKARAWLDLKSRRNDGQEVDERDIRKHRNDVLRLSQLLTDDERVELPAAVLVDLVRFLDEGFSDVDGRMLKQIGLGSTRLDGITSLLTNVYH